MNINDISGMADEYWSKDMSPKMSYFQTRKRKCASWISEATTQLSENDAKTRMLGDFDYRMLRRITTTAAKRNRNHYWSEMAFKMEMAARLGNLKRDIQMKECISSCSCPNWNFIYRLLGMGVDPKYLNSMLLRTLMNSFEFE